MSRAELYRQFNFSDRVTHIYDLETEAQDLREKLRKIEQELEEKKGELPNEIVELYERQRTFDVLKGNRKG